MRLNPAVITQNSQSKVAKPLSYYFTVN